MLSTRRASQENPGLIRPADYARWRVSAVGVLTDRLEQDIIFGLAGDLHGRRLLDVGCGDGAQSILACQRGARVVGIDVSPAMLGAARRRAETHCPGSIEWCQASAEELPFDSQVFDVVIAMTALCFVKTPQGAVKDAARVLRPGGRLIIGELGRYSIWALVRRVRGWLGSPVWREAHFWNVSQLRNLTDRAGLQFRMARSCVYYPPVRPLAHVLGRYDRVLSRLGELGAAFLAVRADKPAASSTWFAELPAEECTARLSKSAGHRTTEEH